ncbi:unnamed protein product [Phytomonas sp. EM1]|nr:unnamed protein product [Phytomonas sp. EM1]|eukprot:CCW64706.1 unnamed protein product [Phytomonas sp. isolate EM1]
MYQFNFVLSSSLSCPCDMEQCLSHFHHGKQFFRILSAAGKKSVGALYWRFQ